MRFSITLALAAIASGAVAAPCPQPQGTTNIGSGNNGNSILSGLLSPEFGNGSKLSPFVGFFEFRKTDTLFLHRRYWI